VSSDTPPRLIHFRVSHYNEKVRWVLDHKRWPHAREAVIPGFHIPRVRRLSGQNQVPVLLIDGRVLADSTQIIAELERMRPDPPVYPADPDERKRALALEDYFDEQVGPDLRALFWWCYLQDRAACVQMATQGASRASQIAYRAALPLLAPALRHNMRIEARRIARAEDRIGSFFDRLEAEIGSDGYLVGDRFSIADLTAAAVMSALVRPPQFPYPLPQPAPAGLVRLQQRYAEREGYRWVVDTYERHRDPSAEIVE
jgi:glutathione S-transferase